PESVSFPEIDPATLGGTNVNFYTQVTNPSVAFDGQGNVYVLTLQSSGPADGSVVLTKFDFTGGPPTKLFQREVYQWLGGADGATSPVLSVDAALTIPPAGVPQDPHANNVYIAWASVNVEPANNNPYTASGFNANQAEVIVGTPVSNPSG